MKPTCAGWQSCARQGPFPILAVFMVALLFVISPGSSVLAQDEEIRGPKLTGELPEQYTKHYLALEPENRDSTIVLTMSFEPADFDTDQGALNFLVLTEDGLRRFLAGADLQGLDIASGSPLQFGAAGNILQAAFTASGSGNYTVIVYNDAPASATYTLTAQGGTLIDGSAQTRSPASSAEEDAEDASDAPDDDTDNAATAESEPVEDEVTAAETADTDEESSEAAEAAGPEASSSSTTAASQTTQTTVQANISARRVSGDLTGPTQRHYLTLEPSERDAAIDMTMTFDPQDQEGLVGKINFWVLTEDGVRRMIRGDNPKDLNLATGFPSPYSTNRNELSASFKAAGEGPYTAIIYNLSTVPAQYALKVDRALLVDLYSQTNEAKAAAAEIAAVQSAQSGEGAIADAAVTGSTEITTAVAVADTSAAETISTTAAADTTQVSATAASTGTMAVNQLAGRLTSADGYHYIALTPDEVDGAVTLALDFEPRYDVRVRDDINFWVLTEDGLRKVVDGAQPADVNIATGSRVQFGPARDTFRAVFSASGRGKYTVIVYNNSEIEAQYLLTSDGAVLDDESGQTTAPDAGS